MGVTMTAEGGVKVTGERGAPPGIGKAIGSSSRMGECMPAEAASVKGERGAPPGIGKAIGGSSRMGECMPAEASSVKEERGAPPGIGKAIDSKKSGIWLRMQRGGVWVMKRRGGGGADTAAAAVGIKKVRREARGRG